MNTLFLTSMSVLGRESGIDWAIKKADQEQLARLRVLYGTYFNYNSTDIGNVISGLTLRNYDDHSFWFEAVGEEYVKHIHDDEFLQGFVKGASEVNLLSSW